MANDQHEFRPIAVEIEESPVSPLGRWMFWLVLSLALIATLWLCLSEVDVVVTTHGKVVPEGQIKTIQPLETGVIRAIHVRPGDRVEAGQLLVEIEPDTTEPGLNAADEQRGLAQLELQRLNAQAGGGSFHPDAKTSSPEAIAQQHALYASTQAAHQAELSAKRDQLAQTQSQLQGAESEYQQAKQLLSMTQEQWSRQQSVAELLAKKDVEETKARLVTYQSQVQTALAKKREITQRMGQVRHEMAQVGSHYHQELYRSMTEKQSQLAELEAKVKESQFRVTQQQIRAPVAGIINQQQVFTVGGVVTPAETLMTLVPEGTPLELEVMAQSQDIGFIRKGMPVTIKLDTYDFQKYGTVDGLVMSVAQDSVKEDPQQAAIVFPVRIHPQAITLSKHSDKRLQTGMTVTAEINTGKRRMIEFFIYPVIKALDESFSIR